VAQIYGQRHLSRGRPTTTPAEQREEPIIRAALEQPYSNGVAEGHVNRLKMIKRTAYGRASFELLRRRVLAAA
jgi:hypothetical protein